MKDYKKILEGVVNIISTTEKSDIGFANICTYIGENCPELKESDDERMKKNIIATIHLYYGEPLEDEAKEMIAWLEKQKTSEEALQYLRENHSSSEMSDFQAAMNIAIAKAYDKGYNDGLEKQGEQNKNYKTMIVKFICKKDWHGIGDYYYGKKYNGYPCEKEQKGYDIYDDNHVPTFCDEDFIDEYFNIVTEEKQGEQKSFNYENANIQQKDFAPKVEPKFHEGEWIVWKEKCYKVNYNGCGYELVDQDGLSTSLEYGTIDENAHIWDVTTDAKDGDVLYCKSNCGIEYIVMNKGINCYNNIDSYFRYNSMDGFGIYIPSVLGVEDDNITPATKEQRDILFQKMKERGYEWDSEKKELKEIEQKPTDNDMKEALRTEYEKGRADAIVEMQKPAWSEEDEETLGWLCTFLNDYGHEFYEGNEENVIDWLKSLKGRVQPKQEWNEEDIRNIEDIDSILFYNKDIPEDTCMRLRNWLKSLRPQNTWKPSDEQMIILQEAIGIVGQLTPRGECLKELVEQLKKLKEY